MSHEHTGLALKIVRGITASEKMVLTVLAEYADAETGECYPWRQTIAEKAMLNPDTVGRLCASLAAKGLLAIRPRKRSNGSKSSNLYVVFPDRTVLEPLLIGTPRPKPPADADTLPPPDVKSVPLPTEDRDPPDVKSVPLPTESRILNMSVINLSKEPDSLSDAQARMALREKLIGIVGDVLADPARSVHAANPLPLIYLLQDLPHSPACLLEEIEQAAASAAAYFRQKGRQMVNWELAVKIASELRDTRLAGVPVKPVAKGETEAAVRNPAGMSDEEWRTEIRWLKHKRKAWPADLGPEPGADGSLVPVALVGLWVA